MKRVAVRGSWDTPPAPVYRKWEVADAKVFIQRLSLEAPGSPSRVPLVLQTNLDGRISKDKPFPTKEISPTRSKVVITSKSVAPPPRKSIDIPGRRRVGIAVCGAGDEHKDPNKQSPESNCRITAIVKALSETKDLSPLMVNLNGTARPASESDLLKIHTKGYLNKLQRLTPANTLGVPSKEHDHATNDKAREEFDSVYMTSKSLEAAKLSAGAAINCVEAVYSGPVQVAAAAIRPPGHHAEAHCAMGFCIFNNAALATKRALELGMKRILIVDQDIHHGNGTQRAFYEDDRVLYFSVHRWDKGRFYPHNQVESAPSCVGPRGTPAAGKTVNVAFCDGEMGDLEYRAVWEAVLLPVVREFRPELILISAGFDAADGDPVGKYRVSPQCFGAMTASLVNTCPSAKFVMLLEGGYNTSVTAEAFCECVKALSVVPDPSKPIEWPDKTNWDSVKEQAVEAVNQTILHQKEFWPSLVPVMRSRDDVGRTVVPISF